MKKNKATFALLLLAMMMGGLIYRAFYDKSPLSQAQLAELPDGAELSLDQVFLVNLDRSKDRLAKMQSEMEKAQLTFTRFSAVDGSIFKGIYEKLPQEEDWIQELLPEKGYTYLFNSAVNRYGLSIGELGNYFSHYEILNMVSEGNHNASLVLEDDARLEKDFKTKLNSLLAHAPAEWDIIYLNCFAELKIGCRPDKLALTWDKRFSKLNKRCTAGNGAYLINARGAKKLLTDALPASNRTDERIGDDFFSQKKMKFNAYCAHPELVKVGDDGSIIDEMGRHD